MMLPQHVHAIIFELVDDLCLADTRLGLCMFWKIHNDKDGCSVVYVETLFSQPIFHLSRQTKMSAIAIQLVSYGCIHFD